MAKKHRSRRNKVTVPETTVDSPLAETVEEEAQAIVEEDPIVAEEFEPIISAETGEPVGIEDLEIDEAEGPKVTKLEPGEGSEPVAWRPKVELEYACECCGDKFASHRARQGEKLCADCVGLRRGLKGFLKRGLDEKEILKRAGKLLAR